jgi:hypothetical protein
MDPFLFAHQRGVSSAVFDFSRLERGISIRDQMIRALMLARRLPAFLNARFGGSIPRPVLIVGGGIAGITAGVALAESGIRVHVFEKDPMPFPLQRNCRSRWIDPHQYDWPLDHWGQESFPLAQSPIRSVYASWTADRANTIVKKYWAPALPLQNMLRRQNFRPTCEFIGGRKVLLDKLQFDRESLLYNVGNCDSGVGETGEHSSGAVVYGEYSSVVLFTGFGREITFAESQSDGVGSPKFWETDRFEDVHSGRASANVESPVLLSGTGDGALQDLLRLTTRKKSARDVYLRLEAEGLAPDLARIQSAELRLERTLNWHDRGRSDVVVDRLREDLHRVYLDEAQKTLAKANAVTVLTELTADAPQRLILVSRRQAFDCIYGLNHFLGLILSEYLRDTQRLERLVVNDVLEVRPAADGSGAFEVVLSGTDAEAIVRGARLVVLRHGVRAEDFLTDAWPAAMVPRPLAPFHP